MADPHNPVTQALIALVEAVDAEVDGDTADAAEDFVAAVRASKAQEPSLSNVVRRYDESNAS